MSYFSKLRQDVIPSVLNSSTGNIGAGATFTGSAEDILGVAGIQIGFYCDQNCTIYVEQSPDTTPTGPHWDISDSFNYIANTSFGVTVQAISAYVRVRVLNLNSTTPTSIFRLQTILCPIVEAVPRSLDSNGNLKVGINDFHDHYGFSVEATPQDQLRVASVYKLIGGIGSGTTVDPNFWSSTLANGGTIVETAGEIRIRTNSTLNGSAIVNSNRTARYVVGAANQFIGAGILDAGVVGNTRRWGAFSTTDGAFFELNGTTLKCVTRKGSVDLATSTGYFNGQYGVSYSCDTVIHTYEIYYTASKVYFVIDGKILHTVLVTTSPWTTTLHLPIRAENFNTAISTDISLYVIGVVINRLGPIETDPTYKYISGAGTTVCKYSPGRLHKLIINDGASGSSITLYDNTAGSGTTICAINTASLATPVELNFGCPFSIGLTIVVVNAVNFTVIYE